MRGGRGVAGSKSDSGSGSGSGSRWGQGAAMCLKVFRLKLIGSNKFIVVVVAVGCPGHETTRRRPRDSQTRLALPRSAPPSSCAA